jgi:hypothetical protein
MRPGFALEFDDPSEGLSTDCASRLRTSLVAAAVHSADRRSRDFRAELIERHTLPVVGALGRHELGRIASTFELLKQIQVIHPDHHGRELP